MTDNFEIDYELIDPITLDYFEMPISLPCCGKCFSKMPLINHFEISNNKKCPNCNACLNNFNILEAPISLNLANIVEKFKLENPNVLPKRNFERIEWKGTIDYLNPNNSAFQTVIGKLQLKCLNDKFNFKTLVITVIDKSGSMGGNPIEQSKYSLNRIADLVYSNKNILANIITYDDNAKNININTNQPREVYTKIINDIHAGGGTSFTAAFNEIIKVLQDNDDPKITSIKIIFLTDGEDSSINKNDRNKLVLLLKDKLKQFTIETQIHTIGFGSNHDYDFLNNLRKISTIEGAYRFADPNEDSDSLSNKINSLLNVISQGSNIPIKLIECPVEILHNDAPVYWLNLTKFSLNENLTITIEINQQQFTIICTINEDQNLLEVWNEWYTHLVDNLMNELLSIIESKTEITIDIQIHIELIQQRTRAIMARNSEEIIRCNKILEICKEISSGGNIDSSIQLKLNDLKFEGKFKSEKSAGVDSLVHKMILNVKNNRNWKILNTFKKLNCDPEIRNILANSSTKNTIDWFQSKDNLIDFKSNDNLNFLQLICSIGKFGLIEVVLKNEEYLKTINFYKNNYNQTALDFAIQSGYWKTCELLIKFGAKTNSNSNELLQTCISRSFWKTAEFLVINGISQITEELMDSVPNSEGLIWLSKMKGMESVDIFKAIRKSIVSVVESNLDQIIQKINWKDYLELFVKPTKDQIIIIDLLLKNNKADVDELIETIEDDAIENTTIFYICCERGYLELLFTILKYNPNINFQNKKGTSCLWIASCNKHLDIVCELLNLGVDPNIVNLRGDPPLIPSCQKCCQAIVEMLMAYGADLNIHNPERDNAILICCRNGAHTILKILLAHLQTSGELTKFLNFSAEIDGFIPLLAAAELNNSNCIEVIYEFDKNLEYLTSSDNKIISGATALHLASFYGKLNSIRMLTDLGANVKCKTLIEGYTPLHLTIKYGHIEATRFLLSLHQVKDNLEIKDQFGRTPEYYAHISGNELILEEFFTNKLSVVFSNLFMTTPDVEIKCANVLQKYSQSPGVYESSNVTNLNLGQGVTPLTYAILSGKNYLVESLIKMGSNIHEVDNRGITPLFWMKFLNKENKINSNLEVDLQINRIKKICDSNPQYKILLKNDYSKGYFDNEKNPDKNLIKMLDGFDLNISLESLELIKNSNSNISLISFIEKLKTNKLGLLLDHNYVMYDAKINLIKILASSDNILSPNEIFAIYLYTSNLELFQNVNINLMKIERSSVWYNYISALYSGIKMLPNFIGEVYRAVDTKFDVDKYSLGKIIQWNQFSVANLDWKNSSELLTKNKGIVFIIKSLTGREISLYSKYPLDKEVIFLPESKFEITNYYIPDIICLAQSNIRNTTFKYNPKNPIIEKAAKGNSSIIIELTEI